MKAKHVVVIPIEEARALRKSADGEDLGTRLNTLERAIRRIERAELAATKKGWRPT